MKIPTNGWRYSRSWRRPTSYVMWSHRPPEDNLQTEWITLPVRNADVNLWIVSNKTLKKWKQNDVITFRFSYYWNECCHSVLKRIIFSSLSSSWSNGRSSEFYITGHRTTQQRTNDVQVNKNHALWTIFPVFSFGGEGAEIAYAMTSREFY